MGDVTMSQRGDQTLVGDKVLVDESHFDLTTDDNGAPLTVPRTSFKVYQLGPNPAYPADSTEETVWTAVGDAYETRDAAVMAAVNLAAGL